MHGCLPGILSLLVMNVTSLQVWCESTGHAETFSVSRFEYGKLVDLLQA